MGFMRASTVNEPGCTSGRDHADTARVRDPAKEIRLVGRAGWISARLTLGQHVESLIQLRGPISTGLIEASQRRYEGRTLSGTFRDVGSIMAVGRGRQGIGEPVQWAAPTSLF